MFNPELFIESLFDDTTQSTLVFDLIEGISNLIPLLSEELLCHIPPDLAALNPAMKESCILSPLLLHTSFENSVFKVSFELPCELNILSGYKTLGTLHVIFLATATFSLCLEGGTELITLNSPPTSYDNYSPIYLEFSRFTFDEQSTQYIALPPKKHWWSLK